MNSDCPALIQCGNHKWAPWAIICTHLMTGESRDWILLPVSEDDNREIDGDWLCPACNVMHEQIEGDYSEEEMQDLRPVCIHCLRELRKRYDPNFSEEL